MHRLIVLFLGIALFAQAKVVETRALSEALKDADKDTLIIFDLDNTIIMPAQMLGGEEWFDYLVEKYVKESMEKGVSQEKAVAQSVDRALVEWNAVQKVTDTIPVEKEGPEVIAQKQTAGARTMALTARPRELKEVTWRQLAGVGIHLDKAAPWEKPLTLQSKAEAYFEKGVMFVGPINNKGVILSLFLKRLKRLPAKIIFVDNKEKHVRNVETELASLPIDYTGCRHGASDDKIAAFDRNIADVQHRFFGKILDNESAKRLTIETYEKD